MIIRDSTVDNKIKRFSDILHVLFNGTYLMANLKFSRLWGLGYMECFALSMISIIWVGCSSVENLKFQNRPRNLKFCFLG